MGNAADLICETIIKEGPIPFARFMELALYAPGVGYYTSGKERVGAEGDFYTSPATHPAFAALLTLQLQEMWEVLGSPNPFWVIEMGAGKGLLARDIQDYSRHFSPAFREALRYVAVERSPSPESAFHEVVLVQGVPLHLTTGCFLSNELLDALPVHLVEVKRGTFQEVYVDFRDGALVEVLGEISSPELKHCLERRAVPLGEGFRTEVNLEVIALWGKMAEALERGLLLTLDYGGLAPDLAQQPQGTLRSYYRHTVGREPYARVGEQDLTAGVDFSAVIEEGERKGLKTLGFLTQREFLLHLGLDLFLEGLNGGGLSQSEYYANRLALLELAKPGGLGDFRVLVQGKGVENPPLSGFWPENALQRKLLAGPRPVPLLRDWHTRLLPARYPHLAWDSEAAWREGLEP